MNKLPDTLLGKPLVIDNTKKLLSETGDIKLLDPKEAYLIRYGINCKPVPVDNYVNDDGEEITVVRFEAVNPNEQNALNELLKLLYNSSELK